MSLQIPEDIAATLLKASASVPETAIPVRGPDFDKGLSLQDLLRSYERIGFQATSFGRAVDIINCMRKWRPSEEPVTLNGSVKGDSQVRTRPGCTVFLGYTSNLISSGLREVLLYLVKHKHVSVLVTTAGGIEEDFIKCLGNTYLADFHLSGSDLLNRGMNRIGNLVVPNENYCKFVNWMAPILDAMLEEQKASGKVWTPSTMIRRLGKEINNEESVYYWAYKLSRHSKKAGMIILGGGVCKHQIANAMSMRGGADYSVYINTGQEFDGSDSGARPDEAVSWGKIRPSAESVKVFADVTLVLPLLVAATFAQDPKP